MIRRKIENIQSINNNTSMEIKKENVLAALNTASDSAKEVILALFPELKEKTAQKADNRPVTERIKTFEDACRELGEEHPFVRSYNGYANNIHEDNKNDTDILAYLKLRIICAALNEGWEPQFTEDEWRYYPWFWLYTQKEINDMDEDEKTDRRLMSTGDYQTGSAGLASAASSYSPSDASAYFGSRLCLKSDTLAVYCGKQFINIWADFCLIRK